MTETATLTTDSPTPRTARVKTLRVMELLQTKVQSVRIELIGGESSALDRLGTWLFYLPFLLLGYGLVIAAAMRAIEGALGWGPTLLLFGVAHLAVGTWGVRRGSPVGAVTRDTVLDPHLAAGQGEGNPEIARPDGGAIPRLRLPALSLPLPRRMRNSEGGSRGPWQERVVAETGGAASVPASPHA